MLWKIVPAVLLMAGGAMAIERSPKMDKPPAAQTEDDQFWAYAEAYGELLREGYEARKAGKSFTNEEFERRVKELGGHPNWQRARPRPSPF
jgi:hypothetical protein